MRIWFSQTLARPQWDVAPRNMEPRIRMAVRFELRVSLEPFDFWILVCLALYCGGISEKDLEKKEFVFLLKKRQMPTQYCHSSEGGRHRAGTWLCSNMELGGNFEVVTLDRHVFRVCSFQWGLGLDTADGNIHWVETNHRKMVLWHGPRRWH